MALTVPEEFDWSEIENAVGITFDCAQRDRLTEFVTEYLRNLAFEIRAPSSTKIQARLKAISRDASKLADALGPTDAAGEMALNAIWPWGSAPDPAVVKTLLREISTVARKNHSTATSNRGRPPHLALRRFVLDVRAVWHEAGGTGNGCYWQEDHNRYRGPLIDLISSVINQVSGARVPNSRTIKSILT